jgi:hypothetical protein
MKFIRKMISAVSTSTILLLITSQHALAAAEIKPPAWVRRVDKNDISAAGEEINLWIFVFMIVVIALFSIKPGYYFVIGKTEEAMEASKNILIGAVLSCILGGIVFAVMGKFS